MELNNQIIISNQPAIIDVNFEELKEALDSELQKYDVVVTSETLPDAKKLATELNATKKIIDDRRKSEVANASEPIKTFDSSMKELVIMCVQGRQKILDQVKRFEDETRQHCGEMLAALRENLWNEREIPQEFRRAEFDDIIKVSSVTAKGALTKNAKGLIAARVDSDKADQDKMERRVLQLENECFRAGLKAPLTREHVNHFIIADDDVYQERLTKLIAVELKRQAEQEDRLRREMEEDERRKDQEEQRRVAAEKAKQIEEEASQELPKTKTVEPTPEAVPQVHPDEINYPDPEDSQPEPEPEARAMPKIKPVEGKVAYSVSCNFVIRVNPAITHEQIDSEARRMMTKAGITTLESVTIEELSE